VTITPTSGLSKVFGTADDPPLTYTTTPAELPASWVPGSITLKRAEGETADEYPITIAEDNSGANYAVSLSSTVVNFTITPKPKYTVTFDTDGGTPTPSSQEITEGEKAIRPATDPSRAGYNFAGWLGANGDEFDFDTKITENITLTAKWTETVPILNSQFSIQIPHSTTP
jgi:uncharacterized repeat protein (TIGR02543 family)